MSKNMCRACLCTKEPFTHVLVDNIPAEMYWYCTSIEIKQEENLPRALCNVCYDLLSKFFIFKQTCIQSQNTLLGYNSISREIEINDKFVNNFDNPNLEDCSKNSTDVENCCQSDDNYDSKLDVSNNMPVTEEHVTGNLDQHSSHPDPETTTCQIKKTQKRLKRKPKDGTAKTEAKSKSTKKSFSCDICGKRFYSPTGFNLHKLTHNSKEHSIQCTACTKTFMTLSGLRRHLQSSHTRVNLKSLKCDTCGKISKSKETLRMHLKTHGERKLFVCDVCGKGFTTAYILKSHLETHSAQRERRFACGECGSRFYTAGVAAAHAARRHAGRRYECADCRARFTDKSTLARHVLRHAGRRPHACAVCHRAYAARSTLVEHVRTHSGERPFPCAYCPKRFLSRKRLADHHRTHTGERPYRCDVCDQAFAQCGTLNRHMKVHGRNVPVLA